jgi:broad-specificity NMP kinase
VKLIVIYGPPAVGKLTVAEELAKLTGYKILHNHMTRDLIGSVVGYNNREYYRLLYLFRGKLVEAAAKAGIDGLIFTFAFCRKSGKDELVRSMLKTMKRYDGEAYFVQLRCDADELRRRVKSKSRRRFDKIMDAETLDSALAGHDFLPTIEGVRILRIDNTHLSARKAAERIMRSCRLAPSTAH